MVQWVAFLCVLAQLQAFRHGEMRIGWTLCLVACVLWGIGAVELRSIALLGQQIVIAGMACAALYELRTPRK